MTLSGPNERPVPIFATLPDPSSLPLCIPPPPPLPATFGVPIAQPPLIVEIPKSRRSRSHSQSHRSPHLAGHLEDASRIPMHIPETRTPRRSMSSVRLPPDYTPVSQARDHSSRHGILSRFRAHTPPRGRSRGRDPIARDFATGATDHLAPPPVPRAISQHYDVSPVSSRHHHRHRDDREDRHYRPHDRSRPRSSSHSSPYGQHQQSRARPTYMRQRSQSVDTRNPRMSRSRPGGAYPAQTQPAGYGYGPGGSHAHATPAYSQAQYSPNQVSMGGNGMGASYSGHSPTSAGQTPIVLLPVSDGRGGWVYEPRGGQIVSGSYPGAPQSVPYTHTSHGNRSFVNSYANANPSYANVPYPNYNTTRGRQSTPGFFSRVFGLGGRSRSAAPRTTYPVHPTSRHEHAVKPVQYVYGTNPRRKHLHRRRSSF
ncbi:hypothetical protein BDN70DRAFT_886140 [Pholiota conissans]|uniref:Uncharacterized protein n=1 Tax=Pholiota conissans TaxID=109636 RepID=A0A9P5YR03_9AGAR|nr:hypothetical protein BDN70DRAFT_886140 [Pholiota conissans]